MISHLEEILSQYYLSLRWLVQFINRIPFQPITTISTFLVLAIGTIGACLVIAIIWRLITGPDKRTIRR